MLHLNLDTTEAHSTANDFDKQSSASRVAAISLTKPAPASRKSLTILTLAIALQVLPTRPSHGEDQVDYRYEYYAEENGRIQIETHSALVEKSITPKLTLKGEFVYDAISGATPTGAPPPPGSKKLPTAQMDDTRYAGNVTLDWKLGNHTLSPQFAYSEESDYQSVGLSLTDAIEFNEKNTTLILGLSQNLDKNEPVFFSAPKHKDSTDALIGVNQLLDPKTVFTADLTFGYSLGYLADPYKRVRFDGYPDPTATFAEKRPDHKSKEILYLGITHFFDPVNGSVEASYRFYHDSFGIFAHTAQIAWYQKIGKHLVLTPMFRYYDQTAADFYAVRFAGDPSDPGSTVKIPSAYSADYRLSAMRTFTYGIKAMYKINDHVGVDVGYERYEMYGKDNSTPDSAYPKANVITAGVRVWF